MEYNLSFLDVHFAVENMFCLMLLSVAVRVSVFDLTGPSALTIHSKPNF